MPIASCSAPEDYVADAACVYISALHAFSSMAPCPAAGGCICVVSAEPDTTVVGCSVSEDCDGDETCVDADTMSVAISPESCKSTGRCFCAVSDTAMSIVSCSAPEDCDADAACVDAIALCMRFQAGRRAFRLEVVFVL